MQRSPKATLPNNIERLKTGKRRKPESRRVAGPPWGCVLSSSWMGPRRRALRRTVTARTSRRPDRAPGFRAMVPPFPREDRIHRDDAGASRGAGSLCEATLPACLCTHRPRPRGPREGATGLVIVWYFLSFPRLFTDMQNFCCQEEVTEVILF